MNHSNTEHSDPVRDDHTLRGIEARLEARSPACPQQLRSRVLAAVNETLAAKTTVPATKSGAFGKTTSTSFPDLVAGTFIAMSVAALPLLATALGSARLGGSPPPCVLSFVERARLAGITIEPVTAASRREHGQPIPSPATGLRPMDAKTLLHRTLLQGDL